jgi:hypothetical protein
MENPKNSESCSVLIPRLAPLEIGSIYRDCRGCVYWKDQNGRRRQRLCDIELMVLNIESPSMRYGLPQQFIKTYAVLIKDQIWYLNIDDELAGEVLEKLT